MGKFCKFQIEKEQVSRNGGQTWMDTGETRKIEGREPLEWYSVDCGWSDSFLYRWVDVSGEYMCNGYHKYTKKRQEVSYNLGTDWEVVEGSDQIGTLVEKFSSDCCQIRTVTGETCDELFRKVNASIQEASLDGETWVQTGQYTVNSVISDYTPDCLAAFDVKYFGIPVSGTSGSSIFEYNLYNHTGNYYDELKYVNSNYVIIGCDKGNYHDNGNIEEIYVGNCAVNPLFDTNSHSTLKKIHISSGVTGILGSGMRNKGNLYEYQGQFSGCTGLTEIEGLDNSNIESICHSMFRGCTSLSGITIPYTCYELGSYVLANCGNLTNLTLNSRALYDIRYPGTNTSNQDYILPPKGQFSGCTGLQAVRFSNEYCGIIYESMFNGCTSLSAATLGKPIEIRNSAFRDCSSLTSITINATTPPTLGTNAMAGTSSNLKIYVPASSVDAYKASWSYYASRIQAIP